VRVFSIPEEMSTGSPGDENKPNSGPRSGSDRTGANYYGGLGGPLNGKSPNCHETSPESDFTLPESLPGAPPISSSSGVRKSSASKSDIPEAYSIMLWIMILVFQASFSNHQVIGSWAIRSAALPI